MITVLTFIILKMIKTYSILNMVYFYSTFKTVLEVVAIKPNVQYKKTN